MGRIIFFVVCILFGAVGGHRFLAKQFKTGFLFICLSTLVIVATTKDSSDNSMDIVGTIALAALCLIWLIDLVCILLFGRFITISSGRDSKQAELEPNDQISKKVIEKAELPKTEESNDLEDKAKITTKSKQTTKTSSKKKSQSSLIKVHNPVQKHNEKIRNGKLKTDKFKGLSEYITNSSVSLSRSSRAGLFSEYKCDFRINVIYVMQAGVEQYGFKITASRTLKTPLSKGDDWNRNLILNEPGWLYFTDFGILSNGQAVSSQIEADEVTYRRTGDVRKGWGGGSVLMERALFEKIILINKVDGLAFRYYGNCDVSTFEFSKSEVRQLHKIGMKFFEDERALKKLV